MRALALSLCALAAGCTDGGLHTDTPPPLASPSASASAPPPKPTVDPDPLGPKPTLAAPKAFVPALADELSVPTDPASGGKVKVWLLQRTKLPIVAVTIAIGAGSARDPAGAHGLAHVAGDMLDEGAGKRGAVELSSAFEDIGASFSIQVTQDATLLHLVVLRRNFEAAVELLADVVLRPRLEAKEFDRVHKLWENDLKARASSPVRVAKVAMARARYGAAHPYGHTSEGALAHAKAVTLAEVKRFHAELHRPSLATIAVAGDVERGALERALAKAFAGWAEPKAAAPALTLDLKGWAAPRLVLVDRPDAPQSVVVVAGAGVRASDADAVLLDLVNTALGASFTSRLNQNLREDKGWTYGARSVFTEAKGPGLFFARAEVQAEKTLEAFGEMAKELGAMRDRGLTDAELGKVKAQDRASLVEAYEGVGGAAGRLASLAALGLPRGYDADATRARQAAELATLAGLGRWFDDGAATRIVVGPLQSFRERLPAAWGTPVEWNAEGEPIAAKKP